MIDTITKNNDTKVTRNNRRKRSTKGMSPMCKQQKAITWKGMTLQDNEHTKGGIIVRRSRKKNNDELQQ